MSSWQRIAGLPLAIEGYRLERRQAEVSSGFTRVTTTVVLEGGGQTGEGEDVTYAADDHRGFPEDLALAGGWTLATYSEWFQGRSLFAAGPSSPAFADYRRWAFESAALDLALRQAGLPFAAAFGRRARPLRFVVSTRADLDRWLDLTPGYEFKLDPEPDWGEPLIQRLAASGRVRVLDLKSFYHGTVVDLAPDPGFYRMLAERFPDTVIEDPALDPDCLKALAGAAGRLSFDAPIHSLADVDALPVEVRWLNIKPSRFGSVGRLLECIDACAERGVSMYGGGQTELGPGRRQIQMLAGVFYADAPNDVAPAEFNLDGPRPGLPLSPLTLDSEPGVLIPGMAMFHVVVTRSGPRWRSGLPVEQQSGWDEHAAFMDALVDQGFLVLGGPLGDEHRVIHAVEAASAAEVRERLGRDPWSGSHLEIAAIEPWTIRLDGRRRT